MKTTAIIPAAGAGERMRGCAAYKSWPAKQFLDLAGRPILAHTLDAFEKCDLVDEIVMVVSRGDLSSCSEGIVQKYGFSKVRKIVFGGERRQDSVYEGLKAAGDEAEIAVVHDAVRPFIEPSKITESIVLCQEVKAVVVAVPVKDTIKVCYDGAVKETLDRRRLWSVQTPQTFDFDLIRRGYERAYKDRFYGTDDATLVERMGHEVRILEGSYENIKITTPEDLEAGEMILRRREGGSGQVSVRVGQGYDVHRFAGGRRLILGGVEIPFEKGLLGHSDADVLCHAIADAILGATASGDIGRHFPDSDPRFEGISSLVLLRRVAQLARQNLAQIINVDSTILAQEPRLAPLIPEMCGRIAEALGIEPNRISVKVTTTEGLGFVGRNEGIAAQAVVLIDREK